MEDARLLAEVQPRTREVEAVNRRLEEASRHESLLLSGMSHKRHSPAHRHHRLLRTGGGRTGRDGTRGLVPDRRHIATAGTHLLSPINTVLDPATIEAGWMDLVLENVLVERLVRDVEAVLPPLVEKNGNTLVVGVAPEAGGMQRTGTRLRQALLTLLSNAATFTEGGTIPLTAASTAEADGQERLTFAVADTGNGMTGNSRRSCSPRLPRRRRTPRPATAAPGWAWLAPASSAG